VDFDTGVHKAPANAPLVWAQSLTADVDPARHGLLNERGINLIRTESSRGIRILGARTMSSDAAWTFVNVRRLLIMIRKAILLAIQWAVMEPNDFRTQAKLRLAVTNFLLALWQRGALMGEQAREAFFVKCDEENNPSTERDKGRLHLDVGVAPSKPFEFIVLRIGRTSNEFEIAEEGVLQGGL
jgi:phage tail sheath protein FI